MIGVIDPLPEFRSFKIGTAFNYTKSVNDTNLHGTAVFQGDLPEPLEYDNGAFEFRITLDSTIGDFMFGEVGLFDNAGQLIDLAVSTVRLHKFKSTEERSGNSFIVSLLYVKSEFGYQLYVNFYEFGNINLDDYLHYVSCCEDRVQLRGVDGTLVTGLADGAVEEDSRDAVNGHQLWSVQQDAIQALTALTHGVGNNADAIRGLGDRVQLLEAQVQTLMNQQG